MALIDSLGVQTSPYPTVMLTDITTPRPGLVVDTPNFCRRAFKNGECAKFYQRLALQPAGSSLQCPYGFTAWSARAGDLPFAVTGIVPWPRNGGDQERARGRDSDSARAPSTSIIRWLEQLDITVQDLRRQEHEELSSRLHALHEVRKLNQTVRVVTERLCERASPKDPHDAPPDLVRAWKASILMSMHMDALDILANPTITQETPAKQQVLYKVVDKVVRIYQPIAREKKIDLVLIGTSVGRAKLDDRTIHIVPSAFVENAIKYSSHGTRVEVKVFEGYLNGRTIVGFEVHSTGPSASANEERGFFKQKGRGLLAKRVADGSGVGLYLAAKVAAQHHATVSARQNPLPRDMSNWVFRFEIPMIDT